PPGAREWAGGPRLDEPLRGGGEGGALGGAVPAPGGGARGERSRVLRAAARRGGRRPVHRAVRRRDLRGLVAHAVRRGGVPEPGAVGPRTREHRSRGDRGEEEGGEGSGGGEAAPRAAVISGG